MNALGPESAEWVSDGAGSFYNATENRRLAELGLVPLTGRTVMTAATAKKPAKAKKSAISGLSKAKLRAHLLAHTTIPDRAWNAAYGAPEREKGEARTAYVKRVLS